MISQIYTVTPLKYSNLTFQSTNNNTACTVANKQLNFKARNPEIRELDDFLRKIRLAYPVIVPSKIETFSAFRNHKNLFNSFFERLTAPLVKHREDLKKIKDPEEYISSCLDFIKKNRVANCTEQSRATWVEFMAKEYENCYTASLYAAKKKKKGTKRRIDHAVVVLTAKKHKLWIPNTIYYFDKKDIIVDPWLGKVDYWFNLKNDYANRELFKYGLKENENLVYEL